ncbi:MAG: flagellar export chaperone FliS [Acidobacteriota bacterium]|jgi:flagellar protein FliS
MEIYRTRSLEGASGVELIVALYDGIIRFLYLAAAAADHGDTPGRRAAVKRALDIIIHLQAQLRMDVGGQPAQVLSEFYAATFAQILQASQAASRQKFEHAIACVRNVRDAWRQVAQDPAANPAPPGDRAPRMAPAAFTTGDFGMEPAAGSRWSA